MGHGECSKIKCPRACLAVLKAYSEEGHRTFNMLKKKCCSLSIIAVIDGTVQQIQDGCSSGLPRTGESDCKDGSTLIGCRDMCAVCREQ